MINPYDIVDKLNNPAFSIKKETLQNVQTKLSKVLKEHPQDHDKMDCVILEYNPEDRAANMSDSKIKQVMNIAGGFMQEHGNTNDTEMTNMQMEYIEKSLKNRGPSPVVNIMWPVNGIPGFFAHDKEQDLKGDEAKCVYYLIKPLVGHHDSVRQAEADGQIIIKTVDLLDIIVKRLLEMGGSFAGGILL